MGLLSGLGNLGLGKLENLQIFEDKTKVKGEEVEEPVKVEEKDFLFDKSYVCPVCDNNFKEKTVRAGRVRSAGSDSDLRPRYENIDVLKYDTVCCMKCGYSGLTRYFASLSSMQSKLIREYISSDFKPGQIIGQAMEFITYEEAISRHKLCLANAIVKRGKESEKAYICLKTAWVIRGMRESLDREAEDYKQKNDQALAQEEEFLKTAYDGFIKARAKEAYPLAGMDEATVDFLLSVLAMRFDQDDVALRMLSNIIVSRSASNRIKDRARLVKDELMKKKRDRKDA